MTASSHPHTQKRTGSCQFPFPQSHEALCSASAATAIPTGLVGLSHLSQSPLPLLSKSSLLYWKPPMNLHYPLVEEVQILKVLHEPAPGTLSSLITPLPPLIVWVRPH